VSALPPGFRWSNSKLNTLQDCGERFRRRYIEGERRGSSARLFRGTIVHRSARETFQRRLRGEPDATAERLADESATEFEKDWPRVELAPDERIVSESTAKANAKDFAVDLSVFHGLSVAPKIVPVAVEHEIRVTPHDADIEIIGTIDLVARTPGTTEDVIRDLKTTEKGARWDAADRSQQLTMYALIRLCETGVLPSGYVLDWLVRTPARAVPVHKPQETTRDQEDIAVLVERINAGVAAVEAGRFVPAGAEAWFCDARYCEFYRDCRYVRRGDRRPTS
jgi:hypothetical protein